MRFMMKSCALGFVLLIFLHFIFLSSCTKENVLNEKMKAGELSIILSSSQSLVKGKNELRLDIVDADAKPIKKATINARFFTEPSQGGTSMNLVVPVFPKNDAYSMAVEFPQAGQWILEMDIVREDAKSPPVMLTHKVTVTGKTNN